MTQDEVTKIGNGISKLNKKMKITPELEKLIIKVRKIANSKNYQTRPMGSQIKNTALSGSDYDLLIEVSTEGKSARKVLSEMNKLFKSLRTMV